MELLGPFGTPLAAKMDFGTTLGGILGRILELLRSLFGTFFYDFSMCFFGLHFKANFNDFPSIFGSILEGFWVTFLKTLIL